MLRRLGSNNSFRGIFRNVQHPTHRIFRPCAVEVKLNASMSLCHLSSTSSGLSPKMYEALKEQGISELSNMQENTIRSVLKGEKHVACTAQTGTGKTLAFLLPIFEKLYQQELHNTLIRKASRPQAIILVPSRELGDQISKVARKLSHFVKLSSSLITGGEKHRPQKIALARPIDILVATPGRLATYFRSGHVFFSNVKYVVIDEADTLMDAKMGFKESVNEILEPIRLADEAKNRNVQYILAAATIKPPLDKVLAKKFKNLKMISGESFHQTPKLLKEEFVRIVGHNGKHIALREALSYPKSSKNKTIVFCNTTDSCRSTEHILHSFGFSATSIHGDVPPVLRKKNFDDFVTNKVNILVCTDIAARGLHLNDVNHVILFDFPKSAVDYVHRAGRTGRAGKRGRVTSFITKYDVGLSKTIAESNKMSRPISGLRSSENSKNSTNLKSNMKLNRKSTMVMKSTGQSHEQPDVKKKLHSKNQSIDSSSGLNGRKHRNKVKIRISNRPNDKNKRKNRK